MSSSDIVQGSKTVSNIIASVKPKFVKNSVNENSFFIEAIYAKNQVDNNTKLMDIALNNPASFKTAFLQLATTSLTLDPAQKLAYLVPRNKRIILDVSYLGLIKMAIEAQMCKNLIVELVFEKDEFTFNGRRTPPTHNFDPFADVGNIIIDQTDKGSIGERGNFRGVYVDYLLNDDSHMIFFVTRRDLASARMSSASWLYKPNDSPWTYFPTQMIRKTAIKSSIHLLPNANQRIMRTIDYLNTDGGEGFSQNRPVSIETSTYEAVHALTDHNPITTYNTPQNVIDDVIEAVVVDVIRDGVKRRIDKLVKRCGKTNAFESMFDEISNNFEFNPTEIKYAKEQLIAERNSVFIKILSNAIQNNDFEDVDNFISTVSGSAQVAFIKTLEQVKSDLACCRQLFSDCKKQNDMTPLRNKLSIIEFKPLSDYILRTIEQN
ncbi:TPA: recombinase RecT [Proteus mirabilis]|nr:recombinase RecT [Proteus mirabilis]